MHQISPICIFAGIRLRLNLVPDLEAPMNKRVFHRRACIWLNNTEVSNFTAVFQAFFQRTLFGELSGSKTPRCATQ